MVQRRLVEHRQVPDVEVDRPDRQRHERVREDPQPLDVRYFRIGRSTGPVSPTTKQSGARSPIRMCWTMCTKKKSCSPIESTGEFSAITTSAIPSQKMSCRQRGTGVPRSASVRVRRA